MKFKLALGIAVQEPKILILHRARSCSFLGVIHDAHARTVVDVDWHGRLWVAKFLEGEAHDFCLSCIEE